MLNPTGTNSSSNMFQNIVQSDGNKCFFQYTVLLGVMLCANIFVLAQKQMRPLDLNHSEAKLVKRLIQILFSVSIVVVCSRFWPEGWHKSGSPSRVQKAVSTNTALMLTLRLLTCDFRVIWYHKRNVRCCKSQTCWVFISLEFGLKTSDE